MLVTQYDNGTFEDVLANWNGIYLNGQDSRFSRSNDVAFAGAFSMKYVTDGALDASFGDFTFAVDLSFPVLGVAYKLEVYVYSNQAISTTDDDCVLALTPFAANLGDFEILDCQVSRVADITAAGWVKLSLTFIANAGQAWFSVIRLFDTIPTNQPSLESYVFLNNYIGTPGGTSVEGNLLYFDSLAADQSFAQGDVNRKLYGIENRFLLSNGSEVFEIEEPINWDKVLIKVEYDEKTYGYRYEFTDGEIMLEFDQPAGMEILEEVYENLGTEGVANLTFGEVDNDDNFTVLFEAEIDFREYKELINTVEAPIRRKSISDTLNARFDEKVNLFQEITFDAQAIPPLVPTKLYLHPKQIFLRSKSLYNENVDLNFGDVTSNPLTKVIPPFKQVYGDIDGQVDPIPPLGQVLYQGFDLPAGQNRRKLNIQVSGRISIDREFSDPVATVGLRIEVQENYSQPVPDVTIYEDSATLGGTDQGTFTALRLLNEDIIIEKDTAIFVYFFISSSSAGTYSNVTLIDDDDAKLQIGESTLFPGLLVDSVRIFEAVNRQLQLITNRNDLLKSDILGRVDLGYAATGKLGKGHVLNGRMIRGFSDQRLEMSMKDWVDATNGLYNTGISIERDNNLNEFVRHDEAEFFFNTEDEVYVFETIDADSYNKEPARDIIYNAFEFEFAKFPDDNEANTIDEWMTNLAYTARDIKRNKKKLNVKIDWILSSYYIELTRQQTIRFRVDILNQEEEEQPSYKTDDDIFYIEANETPISSFAFTGGVFDSVEQSLLLNGWYVPVVIGEQITFTGTGSNNTTLTIIDVDHDIFSDTAKIFFAEDVVDETTAGSMSFSERFTAKRDEDFDDVLDILYPETAYNLEHHLRRIVARWEPFIISSTYYAGGPYIFSSGKRNKQILTNPTVGTTYRENDAVPPPNGANHLFIPNYINFEAPFTFKEADDIRKKYENRSQLNDNFGYWTWINPKTGQPESGYLQEYEFDPVKEKCKFRFKQRNPNRSTN